MIEVTIQRVSGVVETIQRDGMPMDCARKGSPLYRQLVQANADASKKDPAKGGKVLQVRWIDDPPPAPITHDAETQAWDRVLDARERLAQARHRLENDNLSGTGREFADEADAASAAKVALEQYLAEYGEVGAHYAAEQAERQARKAQRLEDYRNSFIGRRLD